MWERLHLLGGKAAALPVLDPRPGFDVRDAVFAFAGAGEVLAGAAVGAVFVREVELEDVVDAQGFVAEAVDGVFDFLRGGAREVVYLALVSVVEVGQKGLTGVAEEGKLNGAIEPCAKNIHCRHWLRSRSSVKPKVSFLSVCLSKYSSSAEVSWTVKGGEVALSTSTGMRPLGSSLRNQSFFCSFVMMLINVVPQSRPYASLSSSRKICTAWPLGCSSQKLGEIFKF